MIRDYEKLEDAVVQQLQPLATAGGLVVEAMPDNDADYVKATVENRLTVIYRSSEYSPEVVRGLPTMLASDVAVQHEFADIEIIIRGRLLRGEKGVHRLAKNVMAKILGFVPEHWGRCYFKNYGYVSHEDGVWCYSLTITTKGIVVQDSDPLEGTGDPVLTEVNLNINQS
jgi:hypothetical protein